MTPHTTRQLLSLHAPLQFWLVLICTLLVGLFFWAGFGALAAGKILDDNFVVAQGRQLLVAYAVGLPATMTLLIIDRTFSAENWT